jgi:SsrA-binding protein
MSWAAEEFQGIDLGDRRLDKQAVLLAERLVEKPTACIPGACGGWAETQGGHTGSCPRNDGPAPPLGAALAVFCGTDAGARNCAVHPRHHGGRFKGQDIAGREPLSYEAQRCMYLHPTYAVTLAREPLGVALCVDVGARAEGRRRPSGRCSAKHPPVDTARSFQDRQAADFELLEAPGLGTRGSPRRCANCAATPACRSTPRILRMAQGVRAGAGYPQLGYNRLMNKRHDPYNGSIAANRKALHEYFIEDRYEAGVALQGWEVKSVRGGRIQLKESYAVLKEGEAWLLGAHISPLPTASTHIHPDPLRTRKLLLRRAELNKLIGAVERRGYTLVPLTIYWKRGHVKLEIGLAKGKKQYDKRATERERDWQRDKQRVIKVR